MISYDEALKIAKETKKVNHCQEFPTVYVFEDTEYEGFGGAGAPIVIVKSTGKVFGFNHFAVTQPEKVDPEKMINEFDI